MEGSLKDFGKIINPKAEGMRRILDPHEIYMDPRPRILRSSVMLPSQYNAYAVCTEFARDWFLEKWPRDKFNSIYVDGSKSFDQFRMFSKLKDQLKRTNPVMAIIPTIDMAYNRNFIDSNLELGGYLRRSRFEGTIFRDQRPEKGLYLAVQFKSIMMNFTYRIRNDTKAQMLDDMEYIKFKHRAGLTESQNIPLDIHVPKKIIAQMAFDNAICTDDFSGPRDPDEMLKYLNSHSVVPFLYKRVNATGNYEYFMRIENCSVHIRSEFPTGDENGDRIDHEHVAFICDFSVEIEMTAPYCYTYYSQQPQDIIAGDTVQDETAIVLFKAVKADLPEANESGWNRVIKTDYIVEMKDLAKRSGLDIDIKPLFVGTELHHIIEYTKSVALNPSLFIDFIIFNDPSYKDYEIDWDTYTIKISEKCTSPGFIIGVYIDMEYVNNVRIHHNFADGWDNPDNFRTSSRIGHID